MTPELQALARRLQEVEKQVAHLAAIVTEQTDTDRTVVANQFLVRDDQGRRRIELGTVIPEGQTDESPWLGLFDANEQVRACIGVSGRGKHGAIEGPWIELYDAMGNGVIEISVEESRPTIRLFNESGKATIAVATSELGPFITISNPNGKESLTLTIQLSGQPWLLMSDSQGDAVLKLAVEGDGPHLRFGKNNKVFWSAP